MGFFKNLVFDKNGIPSLMDVLALISFVVFITASCYLLYSGRSWENYDKFAEISGGGGSLLKIGKYGLNKVGQIWGEKEP